MTASSSLPQGRELVRQLYQDCVEQQDHLTGAGRRGVVDAQGTERTRTRRQRRELETIFGTVSVERTGYGAEGHASLHPLDAQLNLPDERYSLEVRRRAALEASKNSFDETVRTLREYTGAQVGKWQVEELAERAAQDFDAFYEQRHQQAAEDQPTEHQSDTEAPQATATAALPADALLVITSDGKGVLMHRQDLRPATRTASERSAGTKMGTRLSKGEKRNRKRMSTVAAVYAVAPHVRTPAQMLAVLSRDEAAEPNKRRPRPQHKRVWASVAQEPREVLKEAFREATERDPQHDRRWVVVVDGNETQLDIFEDLAEQHGVTLTIVLDIFHVLGYVWKAGHALEAEGSTALEQWVLHRLGRILEGRPSATAGPCMTSLIHN
ncbi:MAG: ISKra4 family transposase [Spirochaetaceae bacterium]|nr:ISKra4 family transposase [Spirochaetaceae bacterium]